MRDLSDLKPPCAYQGGKQRLASLIADAIELNDRPFVDLCCGSGSVSLEFRKRGVSPHRITMVDKSPWGLFWQSIGNGTFDINEFAFHLRQIPTRLECVEPYIRDLSMQVVDESISVYVFLILQASSFGSKAIWIENGRWMNCSFRKYWQPTPTSRRRSPVNPMMPMPATLYSRTARIAEAMYGCQGFCADVREFQIPPGSVTYIDPPYQNTTAYGYTLDIVSFARSFPSKLYVSEAVPLSQNAIMLSGERQKGGISGVRRSAIQEWLSIFN